MPKPVIDKGGFNVFRGQFRWIGFIGFLARLSVNGVFWIPFVHFLSELLKVRFDRDFIHVVQGLFAYCGLSRPPNYQNKACSWHDQSIQSKRLLSTWFFSFIMPVTWFPLKASKTTMCEKSLKHMHENSILFQGGASCITIYDVCNHVPWRWWQLPNSFVLCPAIFPHFSQCAVKIQRLIQIA